MRLLGICRIWKYSADLKYAFCVGICTSLYLVRLIIAKDENRPELTCHGSRPAGLNLTGPTLFPVVDQLRNGLNEETGWLWVAIANVFLRTPGALNLHTYTGGNAHASVSALCPKTR